MSTTSLSLLVALVSVLGFAVPALVQAFRAERDDISLQLIRCNSDNERVVLAASNLGVRVGSIQGVALRRCTNSKSEAPPLSWNLLLFDRPGSDRLLHSIEPGRVSEVTAFSPNVLPAMLHPACDDPSHGRWAVDVDLIHSDGTKERRSLAFCTLAPAIEESLSVGSPYPKLIVTNGSLFQHSSSSPTENLAQLDIELRPQRRFDEPTLLESLSLQRTSGSDVLTCEQFWIKEPEDVIKIDRGEAYGPPENPRGERPWLYVERYPLLPGRRYLVTAIVEIGDISVDAWKASGVMIQLVDDVGQIVGHLALP